MRSVLNEWMGAIVIGCTITLIAISGFALIADYVRVSSKEQMHYQQMVDGLDKQQKAKILFLDTCLKRSNAKDEFACIAVDNAAIFKSKMESLAYEKCMDDLSDSENSWLACLPINTEQNANASSRLFKMKMYEHCQKSSKAENCDVILGNSADMREWTSMIPES